MHSLAAQFARTSMRDTGGRPKAAAKGPQEFESDDSGAEGDTAWDDSALVAAYEKAIEDYKRAHGLAASGSKGGQKQGKKKAPQGPAAREAPPEHAGAVKADGARARRAGHGDALPSGVQGGTGTGGAHRTPASKGKQAQPQAAAATDQEYAAWWSRAQASPGYPDQFSQTPGGPPSSAGGGAGGAAAWGGPQWDAYGSQHGWGGWGNSGGPWASGGYGPPPHYPHPSPHGPPPPPPYPYGPWGQYGGSFYGPPPPPPHAYPHPPPHSPWGGHGAWGDRGGAWQQYPSASAEHAYALSAAESVIASGALKSQNDLASLLMAWYQAGYATGRFAAGHPELAAAATEGAEEEEEAGEELEAEEEEDE